MAIRYPALIDGERRLLWVSFPDIDGVVAWVDNRRSTAQRRRFAARLRTGRRASGGRACENPLRGRCGSASRRAAFQCSADTFGGKPVRANMLLSPDVLNFIDLEAARRKMTRTGYVEWMTRSIAQMGG